MSQPRVLVTGATGNVGKEVVLRLLERGASVRVLTRDAAKGHELFKSERVDYVQGDVNVPDWFKGGDAFKSVERLFLLTLSQPNQPDVEGKIARAAKEAGVHQIVKLSVQGATVSDPTGSLLRWHAFAEEAVLASGVDTVILRPNLFLQNFLRDDAGPIKGQGKFYRSAGNCRISHVDVRDIADVAATVLTEPIQKHSGNTYYISGPQSLTYEELAEIAGKALGKRVEYVPIDDYTAFTNYKSYQLPDTVAHMLVKLFQFYRTNAASEAFLDSKIVTGKDPRSVAQFFADHKAAFV